MTKPEPPKRDWRPAGPLYRKGSQRKQWVPGKMSKADDCIGLIEDGRLTAMLTPRGLQYHGVNLPMARPAALEIMLALAATAGDGAELRATPSFYRSWSDHDHSYRAEYSAVAGASYAEAAANTPWPRHDREHGDARPGWPGPRNLYD